MHEHFLKMRIGDVRMAAKYSLDALNIKNGEKRKSVFDIMRRFETKSQVTDKFGKPLAMVAIQYLNRELFDVLGFMTPVFLKIYIRKVNRIEKQRLNLMAPQRAANR